MGNILETDSSVSSENEAEDSTVSEVRTEGDGMESEKALNGSGLDVKFPLAIDAPNSSVMDPSSTFSEDQKKPAVLLVADKVKVLEGPYHRQGAISESPKQLPPRDKLIVLRPSKLNSDKTSPENVSAYTRAMSTSAKQSKEPKFVPYEPYKGATRSMVEDVKCHSRKASCGSTNSLASLESSKIESSSVVNVPYRYVDSKVESPMTPTRTAAAAQRDIEIENNLNQSQSIMLIKERLRIQEKDIVELRNENVRLKKMLVDSLAGFGSPSSGSYSPVAHPSFQLGSNGNSFSESVDNLTDEIEVWRSKFLSSCVLVEQLTKENQDWKTRACSAAELFREAKQTAEVSLTPSLFNKINSWLHQFSHGSSQVLRQIEDDGGVEDTVYNNHDITASPSS